MDQRHLFTLVAAAAVASCGGIETATPDVDAAAASDAIGVDAAAPVDASTSVTVLVRDEPADPAAAGYFVAYRDGDGAWAPAPAVGPGSYQLTAPSGRYQVALGCDAASSALVRVYGFTVAELPALQLDSACTSPTSTVAGGINGTLESVTVTAGAGTVTGPGSYQVAAFPGLRDVFAATYAGTPFTGTATAVVLHHQVDVRTSPATRDLDFAQAAAPVAHGVAIGLQAGESARVTSSLTTPGTSLRLSTSLAAPHVYYAVPAPARGTALHRVHAAITSSERTVVRQRWVAGDGAVSFAVTPAVPLADVALTGVAPYPRFAATWSVAPTADLLVLAAEQSGCADTCYRYWESVASPAFVAAGGSLALPDLAALPGWRAHAAFERGTPVLVNGMTLSSNLGAPARWTTARSDGDDVTTIARTTTITP